MHIGTIMIFGGILEGVWPINNQKKCILCEIRCQSKSGITGFSKHIHYSIYIDIEASRLAIGCQKVFIITPVVQQQHPQFSVGCV